MKLRTKFRVALLVIALVAVAVPYVVGRMAERRYHQLVSAFNAQYGNAATPERYTRGIFSSEVETRLDVERLLAHMAPGMSASELGPLTSCVVHTRSTVRHGLLAYPRIAPLQPLGPVIAASKNVTTISVPPNISPEPFTLTTYTVMKLDRSIETHCVVPPGDKILAGGVLLTSTEKIDGFVRCDEQMERMLASLTVPHVTLISEDVRMELRGLLSTFSTLQQTPAMPPVNTFFALTSFSVVPKNEPSLLLTNLQIATCVERTNALRNIMCNLKLDALQAAEQNYGPVNIHSAVRNIDADALARLQMLAKNAQHNIASGANPTAAMGLMMASVPDLLNTFLHADPVIDFQDWSVQTPYGLFRLYGTLSASAATPITAFSLMNTASLAQLINADITIIMPETFVEAVLLREENKMPFDITALLEKTTAGYRSQLTFSNAVLTVNGTQLPVPGLN